MPADKALDDERRLFWGAPYLALRAQYGIAGSAFSRDARNTLRCRPISPCGLNTGSWAPLFRAMREIRYAVALSRPAGSIRAFVAPLAGRFLSALAKNSLRKATIYRRDKTTAQSRAYWRLPIARQEPVSPKAIGRLAKAYCPTGNSRSRRRIANGNRRRKTNDPPRTSEKP